MWPTRQESDKHYSLTPFSESRTSGWFSLPGWCNRWHPVHLDKCVVVWLEKSQHLMYFTKLLHWSMDVGMLCLAMVVVNVYELHDRFRDVYWCYPSCHQQGAPFKCHIGFSLSSFLLEVSRLQKSTNTNSTGRNVMCVNVFTFTFP